MLKGVMEVREMKKIWGHFLVEDEVKPKQLLMEEKIVGSAIFLIFVVTERSLKSVSGKALYHAS